MAGIAPALEASVGLSTPWAGLTVMAASLQGQATKSEGVETFRRIVAGMDRRTRFCGRARRSLNGCFCTTSGRKLGGVTKNVPPPSTCMKGPVHGVWAGVEGLGFCWARREGRRVDRGSGRSAWGDGACNGEGHSGGGRGRPRSQAILAQGCGIGRKVRPVGARGPQRGRHEGAAGIPGATGQSSPCGICTAWPFARRGSSTLSAGSREEGVPVKSNNGPTRWPRRCDALQGPRAPTARPRTARGAMRAGENPMTPTHTVGEPDFRTVGEEIWRCG